MSEQVTELDSGWKKKGDILNLKVQVLVTRRPDTRRC